MAAIRRSHAGANYNRPENSLTEDSPANYNPRP